MESVTETPPVRRATDSRVGARLMSVDALRGFDLFWILGADEFLVRLRQVADAPLVHQVAGQMEHRAWEGFSFYDLIFPLFLFLVGVSLVFSIGGTLERQGRGAAFRRIATRTAVLFLLGLLYSGGMAKLWPDIRLMGVLQRIALCYGVAALLFCFLRTRGLLSVAAVILAGYWALFTFVPVPGLGAASFSEAHNWAAYVDGRLLPGFKYYGHYDPEGLLSTFPAIATCLLGVVAGLHLRKPHLLPFRKVRDLAVAGLLCLVAGWLWGLQFPVIKKIWTSSYVLVAGGWSLLLLALFHQVIEVWHWRRWAQPFVWLGMNAIALYLAYNLVDFYGLAQRLVGGHVAAALGNWAPLATLAVALGLGIWLAWFLYRKNVVIKV